jgi:hypothetical protein
MADIKNLRANLNRKQGKARQAVVKLKNNAARSSQTAEREGGMYVVRFCACTLFASVLIFRYLAFVLTVRVHHYVEALHSPMMDATGLP